VSGFVEDAEAWWILEHIPMREFEGIHTRKGPYLQVRRFDKRTGVGVVLLRVSRLVPSLWCLRRRHEPLKKNLRGTYFWRGVRALYL
jgi:hypothetical protein